MRPWGVRSLTRGGLVLAWLLVSLGQVAGQALPTLEDRTEQLAERYLEGQLDLPEAEQAQALLVALEHPLDLNRATLEQLLELPVLTPDQAEALLRHRALYGPYVSTDELNAVEGLPTEAARRLRGLVFVRPPGRGTPPWMAGPGQAVGRSGVALVQAGRVLGEPAGYRPTHGPGGGRAPAYAGGPWGWVARARYQEAGGIALGLTMATAAGEAPAWNPTRHQLGPDLSTGYLALPILRGGPSVILGDYQMQLGQGLTQAGGYALYRSAEPVLALARGSVGARPYTGLTAGRALRGVAITQKLGPWQVGVFASGRRLDGRANTLFTGDSLNPISLDIRTISSSGTHRTATERARHGALTERSAGAYAQWTEPAGRLQAGVSAERLWPLTPSEGPMGGRPIPLQDQSRLPPYGSSLSGWYRAGWGGATAFGQVALPGPEGANRGRVGSGVSVVQGIVASVGTHTEAALLVRAYGDRPYSRQGDPFRVGAQAAGERGLYLGLTHRPARTLVVNGWADVYRLAGGAPGRWHPGWGVGHYLALQWLPAKGLRYQISYRGERSPSDLTTATLEGLLTEDQELEGPYPAPAPGWPEVPERWAGHRQRRLWQLLGDQALTGQIRWRCRVLVQQSGWRASDYSLPADRMGVALVQDLESGWDRWRAGIRLALFDTPEGAAPITLTERGLSSALSTVALSGRGMRYALWARCRLSSRLDGQLRAAYTLWPGQSHTGQGNERLAGPGRALVQGQLRYHWR